MEEVFGLGKKGRIANYISMGFTLSIFILISVALIKNTSEPLVAIIILGIVCAFIAFQTFALNYMKLIITDSELVQKYVLRTRKYEFSQIKSINLKSYSNIPSVYGEKYLVIHCNNKHSRIFHIEGLEESKRFLSLLEKKSAKKIVE